jgi:vacuolar-type H+-ATPase subunit E/Vma4
MRDVVRQLLAAIKETADAEKAEVRAEAEQEMTGISERSEAQIEQFRDEALARLEEQLHVESECIVGRAELEIRDRLIEVKNQALAEVFELAGGQIAALGDTEAYKQIFKRLVHEALGRIDGKDVSLQISRTDLSSWESLKEDFPASLSVVLCDGPRGTVIVETDGGSQSIDNSLETRLETARTLMRRELAEILFNGDASQEEAR